MKRGEARREGEGERMGQKNLGDCQDRRGKAEGVLRRQERAAAAQRRRGEGREQGKGANCKGRPRSAASQRYPSLPCR